MPKENETRLGGLWLKTTSNGKAMLKGRVDKDMLIEAVKKAGGTEYDLTIWLDVSEITPLPEDQKRNTNSPDANLVLGPKWEKKAKEVTADDIPF
jgi:hypothetical protein